MGEHVGECRQNDVWKGSHPISLVPVDSRIGRVIEIHHQVARNITFPWLMNAVV